MVAVQLMVVVVVESYRYLPVFLIKHFRYCYHHYHRKKTHLYIITFYFYPCPFFGRIFNFREKVLLVGIIISIQVYFKV